MILQLKLQLVGAEPAIWRRILVEDTTTLHRLHRMIQILMGWWDYHLYEFNVKGQRYHGPVDEPFMDEDIGLEASGVTLREVGLKKGEIFGYRYDFGDDWEMDVLLERRRQRGGGDWILPWLLDGERAGPPEDCGGLGGLERIVALFEDGDLLAADEGPDDEERRELLEWLGDYDPARFDRHTVNHFLVLADAWGLTGREEWATAP